LVVQLRAGGEFIHVDLLDPIRDPEKDPTLEELESLKPHPSLTQALEALRPQIDPQLLDDSNSKVDIQLEQKADVVDVIYKSSDDEDKLGGYKSDLEESIASFDSIARNADFISLN
jgi:hypothetical protein